MQSALFSETTLDFFVDVKNSVCLDGCDCSVCVGNLVVSSVDLFDSGVVPQDYSSNVFLLDAVD